jgi:triosephosphate isomerase
MAKSPRALVAGNWKMNGTRASLKELRALAAKLKDRKPKCNVMICPPATLLSEAKTATRGSKVKLGGQDCHMEQSGAHTGDISATMLKNIGATAVIVGHSERRADHGETDAVVKTKAAAAHEGGLMAIICVGETLEQYKAKQTLKVITSQIKGSLPDSVTAKNTVVAYEPVWAIGSGLTPTVDEVAKVHTHIRKRLTAALGEEIANMIPIQYGGSVKPGNAVELMSAANVNGALVGGASLKASDFLGIIAAYE